MVGGFGDYFGLAYVEQFEVAEKDFGIAVGYLARSLFLFLRRLFHFVFALVAVRKQMPYVGYVHYALDFQAVVFNGSAQHIHKHVRAQIAYVRVVVHGRSARIHGYYARLYGLQFFFFACERVVYFQHMVFKSLRKFICLRVCARVRLRARITLLFRRP